MAEEVSPESKLYVKEEIEKIRKEIKEEVEKANSKATKTFTTVALIVGLVTGFGVYGLAQTYINAAVERAFGEDALKQFENQKHKLEESVKKAEALVVDANDSYEEITDILAKADKDLLDLLISKFKSQQLAAPKGYALIGGVKIIWGDQKSTLDDAQTFNIGSDGFPNTCFAVVTSLAGKVVVKSKQQFTFDRINDYQGSYQITYIAIGN